MYMWNNVEIHFSSAAWLQLELREAKKKKS